MSKRRHKFQWFRVENWLLLKFKNIHEAEVFLKDLAITSEIANKNLERMAS